MICGQAPLLWATENDHQSVFWLHLQAGADVESVYKEIGQTALSLAVENGHEAIVNILPEVDTNPESKDEALGQCGSCGDGRKDGTGTNLMAQVLKLARTLASHSSLLV
jgi:hypothetical protein